jgi:hypothetical protein
VPDLSVIIPIERDHQHLVAALDGFLRQSVAAARSEIVLVVAEGVRAPASARHRRLRIRRVKWPRRHSLSSALNAGARAARSPVLVLTDSRWRPLPGLAAAALAFHQRYPAEADTFGLSTCLDAAISDDPLLWWLDEQRMAGVSPPSPGIHNWRALRFDALSIKTALLKKHPLPHGENDEWLIKEQWTQRAPIRVFVDPAPLLMTSGRPDLAGLVTAEYRAAHARLHAMRASSQTFAGGFIDDRFQHPEKYLIETSDWPVLIETIDEMTRELRGRHPRFAVGAEAERFEMLGKLYMAAVSHARAAGWSDARAGRYKPI